jgi:sodium transport system permease protein
VAVLFDQGSDASQDASKRLESLLAERGQRIVAQRLHDNALSSEIAIPFQTTQAPIAEGGKAATLILATFLPYILSLSAIMGSVYAANDSVAGEKERGTLETLLLAPLSRRDLVLGKFLAVAGVALVSSLLSVIGLLWPFYVPLEAFAWMAKDGLTLRPVAIAAIILVQVPLAVLGAGVLLAVSTWSKNQKEAQTYLGPVLAVASVASVMSMLLKAEAGWPYAFVPVLNAALVLKQALEGTMSGLFIILACVTSLVYAGAALWLAVHLFERESVLLKA